MKKITSLILSLLMTLTLCVNVNAEEEKDINTLKKEYDEAYEKYNTSKDNYDKAVEDYKNSEKEFYNANDALIDAKSELNDAQVAYDFLVNYGNKESAEKSFEQVKELLSESEDEYKEASEKLSAQQEIASKAETEFNSAKANLEENENKLEVAKSSMDEANSNLDKVSEELGDVNNKLEDAKVEQSQNLNDYNEAKTAYELAKTEYDNAVKENEENNKELTEQIKQAQENVESAQSALDDAKEALKTAEDNQSESALELSKKNDELANAKANMESAKSVYESYKTSLEQAQANKKEKDDAQSTAQSNYDNIVKELAEANDNLNDANNKLDEAKSNLESAKEAATNASTEIAKGSAGFFDRDITDGSVSLAHQILNGGTSASNFTPVSTLYPIVDSGITKIGAVNDASSLENMKTALEMLKNFNDIRKNEGLSQLKVSDALMAYAQINANMEAYSKYHVHNTVADNLLTGYTTWGEISAFGYDNPYNGWYKEEGAVFKYVNKKYSLNDNPSTGDSLVDNKIKSLTTDEKASIYDALIDEGIYPSYLKSESNDYKAAFIQVGHYTAVMSNSFKISGLGVNTLSGSVTSYYSPTYVQRLYSDSSSSNAKDYDTYYEEFMTYYNKYNNASDNLKTAQSTYDEALENVNTITKKISELEDKKQTASNALTSAKSDATVAQENVTNYEKLVEESKAKYDETLAIVNEKQTAYNSAKDINDANISLVSQKSEDVTKSEKDLSDAQTELANKQEELKKANPELEEITNKYNEASKALEEATTNKENSDKEVSDLTLKSNELSNSYESLKSIADNAKNEYQTLKNENMKLTDIYNEAYNTNLVESTKLEEAENLANNTYENIQRCKDAYKEAEEYLAQFSQDKIDAAKKVLDDAKENVNNAQDIYDSSYEAYKDASKALTEASDTRSKDYDAYLDAKDAYTEAVSRIVTVEKQGEVKDLNLDKDKIIESLIDDNNNFSDSVKITFTLKVDYDNTDKNQTDKDSIKKYISENISNNANVQFMNVELIMSGVDKNGESGAALISEIDDKASITITLPTSLINNNSSYNRHYYVVYVHENNAPKVIDAKYADANGNITFEANEFSTYSVTYIDEEIKKEESSNNTSSVTRTEANTPCEEWHKSKNWTWSAKANACVYRVTSTSSK